MLIPLFLCIRYSVRATCGSMHLPQAATQCPPLASPISRRPPPSPLHPISFPPPLSLPLRCRSVAVKLLLDRLVYTPPFLALTLVTLRLLESGRLGRSVNEAKRIYLGTLLTNYKVRSGGSSL